MKSANGPDIAAAMLAAGVTKPLKNMAPSNGKNAVQPRNPMDRKAKPRSSLPKLLLTQTTAITQRRGRFS
jgi:hypothetical protein